MSVSTATGANGAATAADNNIFALSGDSTIAFWIKTSSTTDSDVFAFSRTTGNYFCSFVGATGFINITGTHITGTCNTNVAINDGNWHLIIIERSSTTITFYVDNSASTNTGTGTGTLASGTFFANFGIGANYIPSSGITALITRFVLYDGTAWSSGQRSSYFTSGGRTFPASPSVQWIFASTGALNTDSSGNGHTLTPNGTGANWTYSTDDQPLDYSATFTSGSYTLTGETLSILLAHNYSVVLAQGSYLLTGFSINFTPPPWVRTLKHTSSETTLNKAASGSWTNTSKHSSSETNQTKHG